MVSAIGSDQSDLLKMFLQNAQNSSKSSASSKSGGNDVESTFLEMLESSDSSTQTQSAASTSSSSQMGVPAGMFIEDSSSSGNSNASGGSGASGGSSYDVRDTNQDGVVSQEELQAALGGSKSANSGLLKQLEGAYGLGFADNDSSLLSLTI